MKASMALASFDGGGVFTGGAKAQKGFLTVLGASVTPAGQGVPESIQAARSAIWASLSFVPRKGILPSRTSVSMRPVLADLVNASAEFMSKPPMVVSPPWQRTQFVVRTARARSKAGWAIAAEALRAIKRSLDILAP